MAEKHLEYQTRCPVEEMISSFMGPVPCSQNRQSERCVEESENITSHDSRRTNFSASAP